LEKARRVIQAFDQLAGVGTSNAAAVESKDPVLVHGPPRFYAGQSVGLLSAWTQQPEIEPRRLVRERASRRTAGGELLLYLRGSNPLKTMLSVASLAHVVVGIAGARTLEQSRRFPWRAAMALVAVSLLADLDVLAFRFGIPYSAPFGHRGATHSLVFALLAGTATALVVANGHLKDFWRVAIVICLVAVSHPLLDAMTNGGLGVALLWPLSNARFFAPWRPIPVAPIGTRMLSARGLHVVAVEALWSLPVLVWAVWPRGATRKLSRGATDS
jgi:inner membrane protein